MMQKGNKSSGQQDAANESTLPTRPLKLQLGLLEKLVHHGTDVISFKFARGDASGNSRSQQKQYLNYKAGQYSILNLGTNDDPEGPVRSFTIASSPTEKGFILISTRIRDTPFKKKLATLEIGSLATISAPMGKFVLHDDYSKPAVFLSGGIGVTPFRSMIKYAIDKQLPIKITMFDANRNQANTIYKGEFDSWLEINKNLKIIYTVSEVEASIEWRGEKGFINKTILEKYLNSSEIESSIFYICGPPAMITTMKDLLQNELAVPKERIKIEEFTGY
jgi:glycine betaine catabolism B